MKSPFYYIGLGTCHLIFYAVQVAAFILAALVVLEIVDRLR